VKIPRALRPTLLPLLVLPRARWFWRGYSNWRKPSTWRDEPSSAQESGQNPLLAYFEDRKAGRGIFKWRHYFEIYDRHFNRFRGRPVNVLEIGVYSGGSLEMWSDYFGPQSHIYGVDIQPKCKAYEARSISISIGDQSDRDFWKRFKANTPSLDIVIDDGGHQPEQQVVSFEELFPVLRPGGLYVCEDLGGSFNGFMMYAQGLVHDLNSSEGVVGHPELRERRQVCKTTSFQSAVASVHFYPFVVVVERTGAAVPELISSMHGTDWLSANDRATA
jgi:hypothetical protein